MSTHSSTYKGICKICKNTFVGFWSSKRKKPPLYCSKKCYRESMIGTIFTDEHRKKLSQSMIGRKPPRTAFKKGDKRIVKGGSVWEKRINRMPSGEGVWNWKGGVKTYRKRALVQHGEKCSTCGNNDQRVLEVHHRDGNRRNPSIENLEVLCANCHRIKTYVPL